MKKAKIMLSALGILAVVGGALAFKSNKAFNGSLRCTAFTAAPTTLCPDVTYTATVGAINAACTLKGAPIGSPCPILTHAVLKQ